MLIFDWKRTTRAAFASYMAAGFARGVPVTMIMNSPCRDIVSAYNQYTFRISQLRKLIAQIRAPRRFRVRVFFCEFSVGLVSIAPPSVRSSYLRLKERIVVFFVQKCDKLSKKREKKKKKP